MAYSNLSVTDSYDALLSTTLRNYRKKLEDNIFHELPLLYWLNEKGRKKTQNGGYQIMVPLLYGENTTVQNYATYDVLVTTPQEGITTAKYDWKQMAASITISRKEERQNSGEHQLINLLEAKIQQAEESMRWYLDDQLHGRHGSNARTYSADANTIDSVGGTAITGGGKEFTSLDHLVRFANGYMDIQTTTARTHTVGGITTSFTTGGEGASYTEFDDFTVTASTNAWWVNYSNPGLLRLQRNGIPGARLSGGATGEISWSGNITANSNQNVISAMRAMYNRISDGGEHPDLGLTSQEVFETYEAALMPLERFMDTKTGDAGFQNLRFKGMTLMFDHGITTALPVVAPTTAAPAVPIYLLNSKYISWVVDSQTDFITTPFLRPENQDAKTAQILLMANLVCSNRNKQGVIACAASTDCYLS